MKHIYRSSVFLHSRLYPENSGTWVTQARSCLIVGQTAQRALVPSSPYVGDGGGFGERKQQLGAPAAGRGFSGFQSGFGRGTSVYESTSVS